MIALSTESWELDRIDTVLFDKDGTFIDSHVYWGEIIQRRIRAVIQKYGMPNDAFADLCLSLGFDCNSSRLIPEGPVALKPRETIIDVLVAKIAGYGISCDRKAVDELFVEVHQNFLPQIYDYIQLIDGAKDFIVQLYENNVSLAVITSDTHVNTVEILKYLRLEKYFKLILGKDDCSRPKETGEPALQALNSLGSRAEATIAVGDAPMDFEMAKNAGLRGAILAATGQIERHDLSLLSKYNVANLSSIKVRVL